MEFPSHSPIETLFLPARRRVTAPPSQNLPAPLFHPPTPTISPARLSLHPDWCKTGPPGRGALFVCPPPGSARRCPAALPTTEFPAGSPRSTDHRLTEFRRTPTPTHSLRPQWFHSMPPRISIRRDGWNLPSHSWFHS